MAPLSNSDIKYLSSLKRKKFRGSEKKFLIEGFHLIEECLGSSYVLETIVFRKGTDSAAAKRIMDKAAGKKISFETLSEKSFEKLTETEKSQGIIGVVRIPEKVNGTEFSGNIVIALDKINDPGNLGTIIRTAYWFGINSIIISKDSADIYNSKTLRSSQGAVFYEHVVSGENLEESLRALISEGYKIYLLSLSAKNGLEKIDPEGKSVFVFGSESEGVSSDILHGPYEQVKIASFSGCESLNVAVSAGILMYHLRIGLKIV